MSKATEAADRAWTAVHILVQFACVAAVITSMGYPEPVRSFLIWGTVSAVLFGIFKGVRWIASGTP